MSTRIRCPVCSFVAAVERYGAGPYEPWVGRPVKGHGRPPARLPDGRRAARGAFKGKGYGVEWEKRGLKPDERKWLAARLRAALEHLEKE